MLNDYKTEILVDEEKIQKYSSILPKDLIDIWITKGFGTLMNGYLKVIDPDEYYEVFKDSYFESDISIPILATAFGDIITWTSNKYVGIVQYRYLDFDTMITDFDMFLMLLNDEGFIKTFFSVEMYEEAVKTYGELKFDECFGFVPILPLGGSEKVENLKKVKIKEHIAVIVALAGPI